MDQWFFYEKKIFFHIVLRSLDGFTFALRCIFGTSKITKPTRQDKFYVSFRTFWCIYTQIIISIIRHTRKKIIAVNHKPKPFKILFIVGNHPTWKDYLSLARSLSLSLLFTHSLLAVSRSCFQSEQFHAGNIGYLKGQAQKAINIGPDNNSQYRHKTKLKIQMFHKWFRFSAKTKKREEKTENSNESFMNEQMYIIM